MLKILNNDQIVIDKLTVDKMLEYCTCNIPFLDDCDNTYIINKESFIKFKNSFYKLISNDLIKKATAIKEANNKKLLELYEKFEETKLKEYRKKLHIDRFDNTLIDSYIEENIKMGISLLDEYTKIIEIPSLIKKIESRIKTIEDNNYSKRISDIKFKFNDLINNYGIYEEYYNLYFNVNKIVKDKLIKNIPDINGIIKTPIFIAYDSAKFNEDVENKDIIEAKLITKENILGASFGYILNKNDIIGFSNDNKEHEFISFEKGNNNGNTIYLSSFNPIGVYAITDGSKEYSNNLKQAKKISKTYGKLKIVDIDITKYKDCSCLDEYKKELIDNLIKDKFDIDTLSEDIDYSAFDEFYKKFIELKEGNYNSSNIINLFDFYYELINSSNYNDINAVLNGAFITGEIKFILENNKYLKSNMFRYNRLSKEIVINFYNDYYTYKDNHNLNIIYPGIKYILEYINGLINDEKEIIDFAYIVNRVGVIDSWYISQNIGKNRDEKRELISKKIETYAESKQKLNELKEALSDIDKKQKESLEQSQIMNFKDFLKSNDQKSKAA